MKTSKLLFALTLILVLALTIVIWFFPPNGDFRVDNPFWNGFSTIDVKIKATTIDSFDNLPSNPAGTALLLVPYEPFSASELTRLSIYVSHGGTLVVLDDYGYGNQVLNAVKSKMMFSGISMLDPLFNYKSKQLPIIANLANNTITVNVTTIVLNHATCLNGTADATVIASSSSFSFLDVSGTGSSISNDPNGPFPYAAYQKIDQGYIVALADPSILINGMINQGNNLQFINNVVKLNGNEPQVFIDQGHLPTTTLDNAKADLAIVFAVVSSPFGTLSLIAVIIVLSLNSVYRKRE
jgi:hypothetical protein